MKTTFLKLSLFAQKVNRQHLQFVLVLLVLVLFVLGAGAPADSLIGPR